jgi:hypothetical protein
MRARDGVCAVACARETARRAHRLTLERFAAQPTSVRPTAAKRTSVVLASAKTDAIIEEMKTLTVRAARAMRETTRERGARGRPTPHAIRV